MMRDRYSISKLRWNFTKYVAEFNTKFCNLESLINRYLGLSGSVELENFLRNDLDFFAQIQRNLSLNFN